MTNKNLSNILTKNKYMNAKKKVATPLRRRCIIANWKMNGSLILLKEILSILKISRAEYSSKNYKDIRIVLCPPYHLLYQAKLIMPSEIIIGAQNCYWQQHGAFTGEISPRLLKEVGVTYVLIGHSERRILMDETNDCVQKKCVAVLNEDLIPVVCIGETLEEYRNERTRTVLSSQLCKGLSQVTIRPEDEIVIAYEPVWAIGSGLIPSIQEIQDCHRYIRNCFSTLYGLEKANQLLILYGGSVKPDNATEIIRCNDVDGLLVGGAALNSNSFDKIIKTCMYM